MPSFPKPRRLVSTLTAATLAASALIGLTNGGDTVSAAPTLDTVMAAAGTDLDTNYPIPSGAVFVAPNGSDSASGSQSSPVKSITTAISKVSSGGTIVLRGGTYRQSIGTVNKPFTLQAYPHEKPVITGTDHVTGWKSYGSKWVTSSWTSPFGQNDYRSAEINSAYPAAGKVEQAYRNGRKLQQVLSLSSVGAGKFYVDPTSKKMYIGDDPNGAKMELSTRDRFALFNDPAAGSKLRGIRVTAFASAHLDARAMVLTTANPFTIEHSQFDNSSGTGLFAGASNLIIRNSNFLNNGSVGVAMNRTHNALVEKSRFIGNNAEHFNVSGCGGYCTIAGVKITHQDGTRVINNAVVGNDASGLWCDLGCTRTTFSGNALSGNTNNGIFYEVSDTGTITNNYVAGSKIGLKLAGADNTTATDNHFVNNKIQVGAYDDSRLSSSDSYSGNLRLTWNTKNLVLNNNILQGGSSTTKQLDTNATTQVAAPGMFKSAIGNRLSGNQAFWWCKAYGSCTGYSTLSAFKTATGLPFGTYESSLSTTTTVKPTTTIKASATTTTTKAPATTTTTAATGTTGSLLSDSFEDYTNGWTPFGQATIATSTARSARTGAKTLEVKPTNTSKAVAGATFISSEKSVAGKTYAGSCWVKSSTVANVQVRFHEYSTSWSQVAAPHDGAAVSTARSDYFYKMDVVYTAATTGAHLAFIAYSTDLSTSTSPIYLDDCTIEKL